MTTTEGDEQYLPHCTQCAAVAPGTCVVAGTAVVVITTVVPGVVVTLG